ncbi:MAG: N-acetylmuramoyl-L-alanine amidase [Lachnospiraceae bacterium]|nr:N-acetylmuramoyl-L-alanine amidase [Lachnospiraceae bacterium]
MNYTNSPLICYTRISPNRTSPRNHAIDTITIHCMAGNLSVERCGDVFAPKTRQASSNYGIGSDGRIALYVEEKDRSWCTSNKANDHRAVTIEVANDGGADTGWHVSDKAMASLIALVADICRRNHIRELKWQADKTLVGQIERQNMTVHRWFAAKACPGDYLYNKHPYIAAAVNQILGASSDIASTDKLQPASDIKAVQNWLNTHYQSGLSIDGCFGPKTKKALVSAWQTEAGILPADGLFGAASKAAAASHIIRKGSKSIFVTIWQAYLICQKYNPNGIDGIFGPGCHNATISFQKNNGLRQDGIVGSETWYCALR